MLGDTGFCEGGVVGFVWPLVRDCGLRWIWCESAGAGRVELNP